MTSMLQNRVPSPLGTPRKSPAPWPEDNRLMTPHRPSIDNCSTPRKSTTGIHGARDLSGFSTPQRVTVMGREHDWVEFRTPQHPTSGTNNWGGASPILSRNIPKESLMIDYLKFNTLDDADCGFETDKKDWGDVKRRKKDWVFRKLGWKKEGEKVLGSTVEKKKKKKKGSWLSRWWPQGR